jgi:hypothetical protein
MYLSSQVGEVQCFRLARKVHFIGILCRDGYETILNLEHVAFKYYPCLRNLNEVLASLYKELSMYDVNLSTFDLLLPSPFSSYPTQLTPHPPLMLQPCVPHLLPPPPPI